VKAIIITRDRVTCARLCLAALLEARLDVVIADHGSTWPPMVEWLSGVERSTGVPVHYRGDQPPRSIWEDGFVHALVGSSARFLVTDPNVVPDPSCPPDWPAALCAALDEYPAYIKAGLSLRIDNLPSCFRQFREMQTYEQRNWQHPIGGGLYDALIDTTLAVYRDARPFDYGPALRTAPPYQARHLPWYVDSNHPSEESRYYRAHALADVTHWG